MKKGVRGLSGLSAVASLSIIGSSVLLVSLLLGGEGAIASNVSQQIESNLAQQSAASQEETRAAAQRLFDEADRLFKQGTAESLRQALEKCEESLQLWRAVGNKEREATTLNSIGVVYYDLGEPQKALDYYNQALPIRHALGNKGEEASTLSNIGLAYSDLGEPQKALDYYNQALPLSQAVNDKREEASTLSNIGLTYSYLGEPQKALDYYNQALLLQRAVGDKSGEASTLNNIGLAYSYLGEPQKALDYYNQTLLLHRALGNKRGEATTLTSIGAVYKELGEMQKALDYYERALSLSRAVGAKRLESTTLNNIGAVYDDLGEKKTALIFYERALSLHRAVGNRAGEATTLNNIGRVYHDLGETQKALDSYNQALSLRRAVGSKRGEAVTLNNIGGVYHDLGESQKALGYYNQALSLYRTVGDRAGEAMTLHNIGAAYDVLGEQQKALDSYNQALPLSQSVGDKDGEAKSLNNIGRIYLVWGKNQTALDYLQQALPLYRAVADRRGEATTLNNIGAAYSALGEKQKALNYYNQALPLHQGVGNKDGEAQTLVNLASVNRSQGNLAAALPYIKSAVDIIETLRTQIASTELRTSYFATVQDYYQLYIDLLMQLHQQDPSKGYNAEALNISERARARVLLELLTEAKANIRQGVDRQLLDRESTLLQQINDNEFARTQRYKEGISDREFNEFKQKTDALLSQLDEVAAQIRVKSPAYANLKYPEPLTLPEIQNRVLDSDTLLLEYSLGDERSYLWAVSKTGITSYVLPPRAQIETAARDFLKGIESRSTDTAPARALSQILLAPVASQLHGQRLLIVGDGILQTIPFAALPSPPIPPSPTPLLANHEIVTLPSASTIDISREQLQNRPRAPKTLAVLADPVFDETDERLSGNTGSSGDKRFAEEFCTSLSRLTNSEKEAENLLALVPEGQRLQALGFEASRATATSPEIAQYQIVHLATHGCIRDNPTLSGVVLSMLDAQKNPQDGFLRLGDIFNLHLPAELVVLSACQTGIGEDVRGEGMVGLTRGLMYTGARRVVVSLWSVQDAATSELMARFYRKMLSEGMNPVAALRSAQLEMWQTQQWSAPYYWAAFTVQGEWR